MRSELVFMFNSEIHNKLQDSEFRKSLSEEEKQYIKDRFDCKTLPKPCPVVVDRVLEGYKKMTNKELIEFFKVYEIGEYLSCEEEIDYLMGRIGDWLVYRPELYDYTHYYEDFEQMEDKTNLEL